MTRFLLAGVAALGMMTGFAVAQTTTSETTTVVPTIVAPPPGTLSTTMTRKSVGADGTQTDSTRTTYSNGNGVAEDSVRSVPSCLFTGKTTDSSSSGLIEAPSEITVISFVP